MTAAPPAIDPAVPLVLGIGDLPPGKPGADGFYRGTAIFPIRGLMHLRFQTLTTGADGVRRGELFIRDGSGTETRCELIRSHGTDGDRDPYWHGFVVVEGYEMRVEIVQGGKVSFLDCKQRKIFNEQIPDNPNYPDYADAVETTP